MTSAINAPQLQTLPVGPLDLLVKCALAPREPARAAWAQWRRSYAIDETPWNEVRLLGAVAERMSWLEPEADILPRMKGIQKFLYAQTHMCLTACMGGLRLLADASIPLMALKGAARVISDGGNARQRLVRDADMLVPLAEADRAFQILWTGGWSYKPDGAWQEYWRRLDWRGSHHAWSLSRDGGDLDLHHFSNHLNRLTDDDDGLWARSRRINWRGLEIHVPSPSDGLILGIVHGLRWSPERNADWIIDVASCMDTGQVDWDLVLKEGARRQVQAILLAGLAYLRDAIGREVPRAVTDRLAAEATQSQWAELAPYAAVPMPRDAAQNEPLFAMAVQRAKAGNTRQAVGEHGMLRVDATCLPHVMMVPVPPRALRADVTRLTVRFSGAARPDAKLTATLSILGIVLNSMPGIQGKNEVDGAFHDFNFTIDARLLRRRGAQGLCLTVANLGDAAFAPWR